MPYPTSYLTFQLFRDRELFLEALNILSKNCSIASCFYYCYSCQRNGFTLLVILVSYKSVNYLSSVYLVAKNFRLWVSVSAFGSTKPIPQALNDK